MRSIIHIDMDAFYASIEQRDQPAYRGKPVIVCGNPEGRGVVSTASYEARKYGVHSAMPVAEAKRLCPHGIFLSVRMPRYQEVSQQIMEILQSYTPLIEPLSLDEAFLDVSGCLRLFGSAEKIAREIVKQIKDEQQLSASVGIAPNKFLAKLASDLQKPGGFVCITPENMFSILDRLPAGKVWGVGPQTEKHLRKYGFKTIGDLRKADLDYLRRLFGEVGEHIYRMVNGLDERPVETAIQPKSISNEVTFPKDTDNREFLTRVLLTLSEKVARRLRQIRLKGRTVVVKIRDEGFRTLSRHQTLDEPTDFEEVIFNKALLLAEKAHWTGKRVRLLGVGITNLQPADEIQGSLFVDAQKEKVSRLHETVDKIRDRFGEDAVRRAGTMSIKKDEYL